MGRHERREFLQTVHLDGSFVFNLKGIEDAHSCSGLHQGTGYGACFLFVSSPLKATVASTL